MCRQSVLASDARVGRLDQDWPRQISDMKSTSHSVTVATGPYHIRRKPVWFDY